MLGLPENTAWIDVDRPSSRPAEVQVARGISTRYQTGKASLRRSPT
jgi:hypothetical protein